MKKKLKLITLTSTMMFFFTPIFSQTVVKMEKKNGVYYVPCTVNGLNLKFIFDTGAGDVSISLSEAVFMIKNGYMDEDDLIGTEYYRIANGEVAEGTKIIIKELKIGDKTLYNVKASILHTLSAPLLLGQSAIERFGQFSVEYSTNTLVLGGTSMPSTISSNSTQQTKTVTYDKVGNLMHGEDYHDCNKIVELAIKKYNTDKNSVSNIMNVYESLRVGKCYDAPIFLEISEKVVKEHPIPQLFRFLSKRYADMKNYDKAIDYILKSAEIEKDKSAKAQDFLTAAQFYQQKGDFSYARNFANRAYDTRPGWGEPFMLIGRLYASSGSRCGSGTGWDSQVVVWAAIDMWNKAKNTDTSVANDAQKLINQYAQYMPSRSDILMQSDVSEGGSYTIGCWINITTTVRSSN